MKKQIQTFLHYNSTQLKLTEKKLIVVTIQFMY